MSVLILLPITRSRNKKKNKKLAPGRDAFSSCTVPHVSPLIKFNIVPVGKGDVNRRGPVRPGSRRKVDLVLRGNKLITGTDHVC